MQITLASESPKVSNNFAPDVKLIELILIYKVTEFILRAYSERAEFWQKVGKYHWTESLITSDLVKLQCMLKDRTYRNILKL